jgi:hypothetical protein
LAFLEFTPRQTLYHYTSVDGFVGIIRSHSLWLTDLYNTNDPRELHLGFDKFTSALRAIRENEHSGLKGSFLDSMLYRLSARNIRSYCVCFSFLQDELPMWAAYGANYGGIAIGFRPTAIMDMAGRIQRVTYMDDNTDRVLIARAAEIAKNFHRASPNSVIAEVLCVADSYAVMTALKHTKWTYEQEVRLVYTQSEKPEELRSHPIFSVTNIRSDGELQRWTEPNIRSGGGRELQYVAFPFGKLVDRKYEASQAIEKIILGPKCAMTVGQVTSILSENNYRNCNVTKSECYIR